MCAFTVNIRVADGSGFFPKKSEPVFRTRVFGRTFFERKLSFLIHKFVEVVVDGDNESDNERSHLRLVRVDPEGVFDEVEVLSYVRYRYAVCKDVEVTSDDIAGDGHFRLTFFQLDDLEVLPQGEKFFFLDHQDLLTACVAKENFWQKQVEKFIADGIQNVFVQIANKFLFGESEDAPLYEKEVFPGLVADGRCAPERHDLVFEYVFHSYLRFLYYTRDARRLQYPKLLFWA